ncbi:MAG TPA: alcohol dehydrogenase catalytic domain-containing protein, partial [Anaerolineae bacterium]|nr:alcohol dehydrogenase catalytic domain-containing protein [Anaerolineae bacterium]
MSDTFKALLVENDEGQFKASIKTLSRTDLPEGEVLVQVAYSSLNYKDGLAVTNKGKIVRSFPLVPGIDLAGTVLESSSAAYKPGDEVVLTGWGVGEQYWGGYAQLASVKADWLVPLPPGLTLAQAMGTGTAGFT